MYRFLSRDSGCGLLMFKWCHENQLVCIMYDVWNMMHLFFYEDRFPLFSFTTGKYEDLHCSHLLQWNMKIFTVLIYYREIWRFSLFSFTTGKYEAFHCSHLLQGNMMIFIVLIYYREIWKFSLFSFTTIKSNFHCSHFYREIFWFSLFSFTTGKYDFHTSHLLQGNMMTRYHNNSSSSVSTIIHNPLCILAAQSCRYSPQPTVHPCCLILPLFATTHCVSLLLNPAAIRYNQLCILAA